jgi:class 3 adenylate cyclase
MPRGPIPAPSIERRSNNTLERGVRWAIQYEFRAVDMVFEDVELALDHPLLVTDRPARPPLQVRPDRPVSAYLEFSSPRALVPEQELVPARLILRYVETVEWVRYRQTLPASILNNNGVLDLQHRATLRPERDPVQPTEDPDLVLATVLATDIVDSTKWLETKGPVDGPALQRQHGSIIRAELSRFGGEVLNTGGDSFLATFSSPSRAIRCALAIRDAVRSLGIEIRAGLHVGEFELAGADTISMVVNTADRVLKSAAPGEVRVSSMVRDLVSRPGLEYVDQGVPEMKNVSRPWQVFVVDLERWQQ